MTRNLKIAVVQMDVTPAPTSERLVRAERLATQAAEAGAQLIALPEVFNTGYVYDESNHQRVERLDGPTVSRMKATAARLNVHLAGSLMLLDEDEVYNALILVAPDGRLWRYDKTYPWGWERGYFRGGGGIRVANTDLGHIGLLICWDVGHRDLWQRYAGQVDLMLICSSPPNLPDPIYRFPDGGQLTSEQMGPVFRAIADHGPRIFVDMVAEQTAWLGVPAVQAAGSGRFDSPIPQGRGTLLSMLPFAPRLAKHLPLADGMRASCDMLPATRILNADGSTAVEPGPDAGESFVVAAVTLAPSRPQPTGPQPPARTSWFGYLVSDWVLPWLTLPVYRRGLRRVWGARMAPKNPATRYWKIILGLGTALSFGLGWLIGRSNKK